MATASKNTGRSTRCFFVLSLLRGLRRWVPWWRWGFSPWRWSTRWGGFSTRWRPALPAWRSPRGTAGGQRVGSLKQLSMQMRSADDGVAPFLKRALLNFLTVLIGLGPIPLGDFQPDEVLDAGVGDLLFDDLFRGSWVIVGLLKERDGLFSPALIAF